MGGDAVGEFTDIALRAGLADVASGSSEAVEGNHLMMVHVFLLGCSGSSTALPLPECAWSGRQEEGTSEIDPGWCGARSDSAGATARVYCAWGEKGEAPWPPRLRRVCGDGSYQGWNSNGRNRVRVRFTSARPDARPFRQCYV